MMTKREIQLTWFICTCSVNNNGNNITHIYNIYMRNTTQHKNKEGTISSAKAKN